ncbi:MAG: hypothetical protein JSW11_14480 [Candidatus Heimdallarchaeota archaeon]|nr:MAG: hypothetical protein JSW11_14480 [Candidatus Heimdallarchaeota archaeon]
MTELKQPFSLRHTFYPKCPYNDSVVILISRLGVIVLGTLGLSFLNVLVAGIYLLYSVIYNILIWPIIHCQYCYYKVKGPAADSENGGVTFDLLPLEEWKESYLHRHVTCGKKWGTPNLVILWLGPILLIPISFFVNFSVIALLSLISFIGFLAIFGIYMRKRVCLKCAFMEECHAAF